MTDIYALQKKWQETLAQSINKIDAATAENNKYAADISTLEARIAKSGISRLKNPFIKATKISPLRRKQKKNDVILEQEKQHLIQSAQEYFRTLGEASLNISPALSDEYTFLQCTLGLLEDVQKTINASANQCNRASKVEIFTAFTDSVALDALALLNASRVSGAIEKANKALDLLKRQMEKAPQVDGRVSADISDAIGWTMVMDMLGGFAGTWGNLSLAGKLSNARDHLRDVSANLDKLKKDLTVETTRVLATSISQKSAENTDVRNFMASLETYLPQVNIPAAPRKNNQPGI